MGFQAPSDAPPATSDTLPAASKERLVGHREPLTVYLFFIQSTKLYNEFPFNGEKKPSSFLSVFSTFPGHFNVCLGVKEWKWVAFNPSLCGSLIPRVEWGSGRRGGRQQGEEGGRENEV